MDQYRLFKLIYDRTKIPLLCLVCFGMGIVACWFVLAQLNLRATRLFYYQVRNPYEKALNKEEIAEMDGQTVILREAMYHIRTSYYRDVGFKEISADFMRRQNVELDSHTLYIAPGDTSEFDETFFSKSFGGIGIQIFGIRTDSTDKSKTRVVIGKVFPKTPSEEAGILKGDTIVAVDGKKVFLAEEAKNLIRGEIGTTTTLELIRPGTNGVLEKIVERKSVVIPPVTWERAKEDTTIGLVNIYSFSKFTPSLFQLAISSLRVHGANKIILDLRGSRGGVFDYFPLTCFPLMNGNDTVAVSISRKEKVIYDSTYIASALKGKNPGRFKDVRIVCLIDGNTGSASEFLAKTLQRWGYILVGEPTAGKISILQIIRLSDGSRLLVAVKKIYFGGRQEEIPETGLVPNVLIKNNSLGKDLQLEKAIKILEKGGK